MTRRRMISFALAVVMLLSTAVIPINAESEIQYTEADLHEMITYADAVAAGHVNRLNDEEDMNTLIFANRDNTKTMYYYGENIKYTDENGTVRDKTNKLTYSNGVYVNEDNDINVAIPTSLSSGVTLTYEDVEIIMTPEFVGAGSLTSTAPTATLTSTSRGQADNVTYDSVFGSGISVRYTPMYSGIKEDIILSSYTGTYSFDFTIDTNGLLMLPDTALAEAEEETELDDSLNADDNATLVTPPNWYFATREDPTTPVAWLSEIYIYDSAGNTALGSVSVEQTAASEYSVTVIADKAFLEAETTVYPVTVDPTLTLEGTINSKEYIEDSVVYSSSPSSNYGSTTVLLGNTTRSIFLKFPGLSENQQMIFVKGSQIARFYVSYYSTGVATNASSASYSVYNVTDLWDESTITYNNMPTCSSSASNTSSVTGTAGYKTIDISNSARQWGNVAYDAAYHGVKLTFADSMKFYSSEIATDAYKPYLTINYDSAEIGIYKIKNGDKYIGLANNHSAAGNTIKDMTIDPIDSDTSDDTDSNKDTNDFAKDFRVSYVSSVDAYTIRPLASKNGYGLYLRRNGSSLELSSTADYFKFVLDSNGNFTIVDYNAISYAVTLTSSGITMASNTSSSDQKWSLNWSDRNELYDFYLNLGFAIPFASPMASSRYGVRDYNGVNDHWGMDFISSQENQTILSVSSGTIMRNKFDDGYGYYVVVNTGIEHPYESGKYLYVLYAHLAEKPSLGNTISKGEAIGIMGNTGNSDGTHLHIQFYFCGTGDAFTVKKADMNYGNTIDPHVFYPNGTFTYSSDYGN